MATLRQSSTVNMAGWQPNPPQPSTTAQTQKSSPPDTRNKRSPNMLAPMPIMASTADAFDRQFYGGGNVPTYRILPTKSEGAK
jgi:hypothetical protein